MYSKQQQPYSHTYSKQYAVATSSTAAVYSSNKQPYSYGPCRTSCPFYFRLITLAKLLLKVETTMTVIAVWR